jgi:predicted DNA-binding ribbon-helix-helix protein
MLPDRPGKTDASHLATRYVSLDGGPTTIALEPIFWSILEQISKRERVALTELIQRIEDSRGPHPRASRIRTYVLTYYVSAADIGENGGASHFENSIRQSESDSGALGCCFRVRTMNSCGVTPPLLRMS